MADNKEKMNNNTVDIAEILQGHPEIPQELPVLASPQYVIYPFMIVPMLVKDEKVIQMVDDVVRGQRMIGIFARRPIEENAPEEQKNMPPAKEGNGQQFFNKIYNVGTAAMVLKMLKIPDGTLRLLVHGVRRIRIVERLEDDPYPRAIITPLDDIVEDDNEMRALKISARDILSRMIEQTSLPGDLLVAANNMDDPGRLADLIASNLSLKIAEQQEILEILDTRHRLIRVQEILARELEIAKLGSKIQSRVKDNLDQHQRDMLLREQLKAIQRELGDEEGGQELEELREAIEAAGLPEKIHLVATKELTRLRQMSPASAEYTVSRTYLDWILNLPWSVASQDNIDLKKAIKILDEDHFDLSKIKERILEYLAVIKLRKAIKGPILCLVGPPGVGKTSLGRSVARSMGRKFVRISLGGVRDEAEIRGHRRTYIGALPGSVIKSLKEAGSNNPVFMLDEIDKLGNDFRGDPSSALLEVLDPEQNNSFVDHYLDLPFDLSKVMFITTANTLDSIPGPLRDRMEVLQLSGYTLHEKIEIARRYLLPRAIDNTGLKSSQATFSDDAFACIIESYTREAGLRNLEREITNVCRKIARRIAEGDKKPVKVDREHIIEALGPERIDRDELDERRNLPGVAVGLAWTPSGGDILFIEAATTPGRGRLTLTGQLGDVMKESVQAALTYLHAHAKQYKIPLKAFTTCDLHVHVPAGAIPKDGPSAGITMMTAVASLLRNQPIRERLAMTGEITLKGTVLPIGGIKEKVLAAHRSGVDTIILPKRNEKDLIDIPEEIREQITFYPVEHAEEVLKIAFSKAPAKTAAPKKAAPKKTIARKKAVTKAVTPKPAPSKVAPKKKTAVKKAVAKKAIARKAAPVARKKKATRKSNNKA